MFADFPQSGDKVGNLAAAQALAFETLGKGLAYGGSQGFTGEGGDRACQPVGFGIFETEGHSGSRF
jgi:hypothetical protein